MKKFKTILLLLLLSSFFVSAFAKDILPEPVSREKTLSVGGIAGKEIFDHLLSNGVLKLNGTTVQNLLRVQGTLIAQSARLGSLDVVGEANLTDTSVNQTSVVTGHFRAQGSTFHGPLTLSAHKAVFTASTLASITVQRQEAFKGKQIIELKQGTIVEGPIIFESGKGEVHLYPKSKIYHPIEGGKLIRKN